MGPRPFVARSVAYPANSCDPGDLAGPAHDPCRGDGSSATENDEPDDAAYARRDQLESGGRIVLYWAFSNLIAIVQQVVMNRTELGREMRAELEKRARKSKGK